jgi:hypothetical protein
MCSYETKLPFKNLKLAFFRGSATKVKVFDIQGLNGKGSIGWLACA